MSDVAKAAERLRQPDYDSYGHDDFDEARRVLAEWALPLLDQMPIDEAFMLSAGFDDVGGCMMAKHGENVVAYLKSVKRLFVQGRGVDGINTRGQLRMLCAALGIELKSEQR